MAENYADKRDGIYEGGSNFSNYKGVDRYACAGSYGVPPQVEITAGDELSSYAKSRCANKQIWI